MEFKATYFEKLSEKKLDELSKTIMKWSVDKEKYDEFVNVKTTGDILKLIQDFANYKKIPKDEYEQDPMFMVLYEVIKTQVEIAKDMKDVIVDDRTKVNIYINN